MQATTRSETFELNLPDVLPERSSEADRVIKAMPTFTKMTKTDGPLVWPQDGESDPILHR